MTRDDRLDRLRGLAVLLMVVDHALAFAGTGLAFRLTLTRAALPIFALIAGYLLADRLPSRRRMVELVAAASIACGLASAVPWMPDADVLASIFGALLLWPAAVAAPVLTLTVAAVASFTFAPFLVGYNPAYFLSIMVAGLLLRRHGSGVDLAVPRAVASVLPPVFGSVGRRPLAWYLGHLGALVGLWAALTAAA